ncbi:hypothetical protein J2Y38_004555 [Flavobacterium sp. 2755]|uniref:hypothetical protein n=1 Tax=Flavobacterium sp. 2755 TaxID=2817765 RepID=UPI00285F7172|nr:hypothetical protein [Flavobacterium sp. 2755]MDR6764322.1 hypothetical protein [Flavobacterium sp. 2755]
MEPSSISTKILQILAHRDTEGCTLEELTSLVIPAVNSPVPFTDQSSVERKNQARVLEVLIVLDDQGDIFLNSSTDRSTITIKGLIKVRSTLLCN